MGCPSWSREIGQLVSQKFESKPISLKNPQIFKRRQTDISSPVHTRVSKMTRAYAKKIIVEMVSIRVLLTG
jgi:hypothetical protein